MSPELFSKIKLYVSSLMTTATNKVNAGGQVLFVAKDGGSATLHESSDGSLEFILAPEITHLENRVRTRMINMDENLENGPAIYGPCSVVFIDIGRQELEGGKISMRFKPVYTPNRAPNLY